MALYHLLCTCLTNKTTCCRAQLIQEVHAPVLCVKFYKLLRYLSEPDRISAYENERKGVSLTWQPHLTESLSLSVFSMTWKMVFQFSLYSQKQTLFGCLTEPSFLTSFQCFFAAFIDKPIRKYKMTAILPRPRLLLFYVTVFWPVSLMFWFCFPALSHSSIFRNIFKSDVGSLQCVNCLCRKTGTKGPFEALFELICPNVSCMKTHISPTACSVNLQSNYSTWSTAKDSPVWNSSILSSTCSWPVSLPHLAYRLSFSKTETKIYVSEQNCCGVSWYKGRSLLQYTWVEFIVPAPQPWRDKQRDQHLPCAKF